MMINDLFNIFQVLVDSLEVKATIFCN